MVKFTGCIVIVLGTTLIGFKYADRIKQRYHSLMYLKKVLIMLRGEIDYNQSVINQIFEELHRKTRGSIKEFFGNLYKRTSECYEKSIGSYWNEEVDKCLKDMSYSQEDLMKIKELGENLGYLDKKMQLNNIDYIIDYIEKETKELYMNMDKNMKMCKMFGALAGIFIIIVFC